MTTTTEEIGDGIYRISTFAPDPGLGFNQFLIDAEEPFLFHLGMRGLFAQVSEAVERIMPVSSLRWLSFGHFEADECGAMNQWLEAAPNAQVAVGGVGCMVSVGDAADRPPLPLEDNQVLDIGGRRLQYLATPHVPHGWDAGVFFEETTSTLFCGDLFTEAGEQPAMSTDSPLDAAIATEEMFGYTANGPNTAPTLEGLAGLEPSTLALMHGSTHSGPGAKWLMELAEFYRSRGGLPAAPAEVATA